MENKNGHPGGLSSDDEAVPASPKASIPDAFMTDRIRALLPRVVSRRDRFKDIADRWQAQYPEGRNGINEKLYDMDMDIVSRHEIDSLIGNSSWTELCCDICELDRDAVVSVPREYDNAQYVCGECAQGVLEILSAKAIEAGTGKTEGLDPKDDSAVRKDLP